MTTEVANSVPMLSDIQRAEIKSFDDALALLSDAGIATSSITDYGDGFEVMDKSNFVNVKFVILDYKILPAEKSDYDSDFVVIRLVTVDGTKALITDGSTGVRDQILALHKRNVFGGIMCEKGLLVSEYDYVDDKGKKTPAKTYYFAGM